MPFIPHTPESLLGRSDSKNPATTCKGITSAGKPCRRPIGTSPHSTPTSNRRSKNGVVAVLQPTDEEHDGAAAFFCWQHQDQADRLAAGAQTQRQADIVRLEPRTSIDTLVERIGILEVEDNESPIKVPGKKNHTRQARKQTLPQNWQAIDGPLLAVPSRGGDGRSQRTYSRNARQHEKNQLNLSFFCCVTAADKDHAPPPRVRKHVPMSERSVGTTNIPPSLQRSKKTPTDKTPNVTHEEGRLQGNPAHTPCTPPNKVMRNTERPSVRRDPPSQTQDLLSLIPRTLSPQTTSTLLVELAKPVSSHDEEGFIYMFWLTDTTVNTPDPQAVSSLLSNTSSSATKSRRASDFMQAHNSSINSNTSMLEKRHILLKIGRASNVQRRMNEWTRQCGYNLSLIRFYPHVQTAHPRSSTSSPSFSPSAPQKVLNAHKVERLIHLELVDQRVKRKCESCGKEHREWFEVEGTREGLRAVDEVIQRWVSWGQRNGG